jgi:hypothetical protein
VPTKAPTERELEDLWDSIGTKFSDEEHDSLIKDLRVLIRAGLDSAVYRVPDDIWKAERLKTALSMVDKWHEDSAIDEKTIHENTYKYVARKLNRAIDRPFEL